VRLLLVDDDPVTRDYDSARLWDGSCNLIPIQWLAQLRDHDPATVDGVVLGATVQPALFREAVEKCSRNQLPLVLLGAWNEALLRHARSRHHLVVHYPPDRAKTLTGKLLCETVTQARKGLHRPRARAIIGNPTLRTVVQALLEGAGFKVESHPDLASARRAATSRDAPAVTVAEVFLPDGNGLTVLPTDGYGAASPVILLSQSREPWIVDEAHRRGAHAVVTTPLDPDAFTAFLKGVSPAGWRSQPALR